MASPSPRAANRPHPAPRRQRPARGQRHHLSGRLDDGQARLGGHRPCGTKFDQPLFGLKGLDGKPVGFDVEIAKIVAAKLGIPADKITYTETPSKIREDVLANNQVDMVVATYTINDARKQKVSFAGPYYVAGQDLMVKADNTTITGPSRSRARTPVSARSAARRPPRTSRSTWTRATSCCSTCTPSAPTRCATAR